MKKGNSRKGIGGRPPKLGSEQDVTSIRLPTGDLHRFDMAASSLDQSRADLIRSVLAGFLAAWDAKRMNNDGESVRIEFEIELKTRR